METTESTETEKFNQRLTSTLIELNNRENSSLDLLITATEKSNRSKNQLFARNALRNLFPEKMDDIEGELSDDVMLSVLCRHSKHVCSVALLLEETFNARSGDFVPLLLMTSLEESGADVIKALPLLLTLDDVTTKAKKSPSLLLTILGFEKSPSPLGLDVNKIVPLLMSNMNNDDVIMTLFNATRPDDVTPYLMTSEKVEKMARFLIVSGFSAERTQRILPFLLSEEGF